MAVMDQLAVYDSQVSEDVSEDDVVQVVQSDHEGSNCDEVGSQEYETVELDERVFSVVSITPRQLNLDVDQLPARNRKGMSFCADPQGPQPKATRGWSHHELSNIIQHLGLEGAWKQGGKEKRAVFEGPDPTRPDYIINYESSSCWVQGKKAQEVDLRIRAARRR